MQIDMPKTKKVMYGSLFVAIVVVFGVLVLIKSWADNSTETATVSNAAPSVDSTTISTSSYGSSASSLTLTENTTTTTYVFGTATDTNGCEDIDATSNYALQMYRTDVSGGSSCTADDNDCYRATSATTVDQCTAGGSDTTARYQFNVAMNYFADATDTGAPNAATNWTARVVTTDDSSAASSASTATTEVASLIALDATSSISYGTIALAGTSSQQTATITNTGNRNMDATVAADGGMTCDGRGTISVGQVHWSLTSSFAYASGTVLTTSAVSLNNSTAQRTGGVSSTPSYWLLQLPSTGIAGTCTNTLTLTAQADS